MSSAYGVASLRAGALTTGPLAGHRQLVAAALVGFVVTALAAATFDVVAVEVVPADVVVFAALALFGAVDFETGFVTGPASGNGSVRTACTEGARTVGAFG